MLKLKSKLSVAAVIGVGLVAIGGGAAIATSDNSPANAQPLDPTVSVGGDLKAFPIFRRAQGSSPDRATADILGGRNTSGQNIALALATAGPDGPVWVAPGRNKLCINMPDPVDGFGVVCADSAKAAREGALGIMVDPRRPTVQKISLVLADGAKAVATRADGTITRLATVDGVANEAIEGARTVTVTAADGTEKVYELPGPPPVHPTPEEKALVAAEKAATEPK